MKTYFKGFFYEESDVCLLHESLQFISERRLLCNWIDPRFPLQMIRLCSFSLLQEYKCALEYQMVKYSTNIFTSSTIILSFYHTVFLSYCLSIILSFYNTVFLSYSLSIILSVYHTLFLSYSLSIKSSYYHTLLIHHHAAIRTLKFLPISSSTACRIISSK